MSRTLPLVCARIPGSTVVARRPSLRPFPCPLVLRYGPRGFGDRATDGRSQFAQPLLFAPPARCMLVVVVVVKARACARFPKRKRRPLRTTRVPSGQRPASTTNKASWRHVAHHVRAPMRPAPTAICPGWSEAMAQHLADPCQEPEARTPPLTWAADTGTCLPACLPSSLPPSIPFFRRRQGTNQAVEW
jgi:hypothetical protein